MPLPLPVFYEPAPRARKKIRLAAVALPLLLAGCAALAPSSPAPQAQGAPAAERPYHQAIDLGGRLSVHYQQNGAEQAVHGSFTWSQHPEHTVISLLSPLGQTMATIDIGPGRSVLTQAGQPPRVAADVDALAAETLGWPLPVSGLRDWLQGFATTADGSRFMASPLAAPASVTTRDGWRLTYSAWQDGAPPAAGTHPRRIDLERSTTQAGDVAMRIVIDNWQPRDCPSCP